MPSTLAGKLVVAISSRALFDFEEENAVFEQDNDHAYMRLQQERIATPAQPGAAYPLVRKLLAFNTPDQQRVEVVILSRNDPASGLRVFRSANHHGLAIERGVFTRGEPAYGYLRPLGAHLFLSMHEADVREALQAGFPAARVYARSPHSAAHPAQVRIAFDGDAVLFSDEAEAIFQRDGLDQFQAHEQNNANQPLGAGPFKPLLAALQALKSAHEATGNAMQIRTALVTARSAPAHERAIRTLASWGLDVDVALFLGGLEKAPFLREFAPDFFFDDQTRHCDTASAVAPTGHVAAGIVNLPKKTI